MKHLHTFTQHINESQLKVIDQSTYWKMTSDRANIGNGIVTFTPDEAQKLYDLYGLLDPDKNGVCYRKRNGRFEIRLQPEEGNRYPFITIIKHMGGKWLLKVEKTEDDYEYHESESLESLIIHITAKYGPAVEIAWLKIR